MTRPFWVRPVKIASYLFCFSLLNLACASDGGDSSPEEAVSQSEAETPSSPTNEFDQAYQEATQTDQNSAADHPTGNPDDTLMSSETSTPPTDALATTDGAAPTDTPAATDAAPEAPATADVPAADSLADAGAGNPTAVAPEEEVNTAPDYTLQQTADGVPPADAAASADAGISNQMKEAPSVAEPAAMDSSASVMPDATQTPKVKKHHKSKKMAKRGKRRHAAAAPMEAANDTAVPMADGTHGQYIVQRGDSLSKIADRIYGSKKHWHGLAKLNGMKNPKRLYPGDVVVYEMSEKTAKFDSVYKGIEMQEVVVQSGDTLGRIAKRALGSADAWRTLWKMNRDTIANPNKIEVGTKLKYYNPKKLSQALIDAGLMSAH